MQIYNREQNMSVVNCEFVNVNNKNFSIISVKLRKQELSELIKLIIEQAYVYNGLTGYWRQTKANDRNRIAGV